MPVCYSTQHGDKQEVSEVLGWAGFSLGSQQYSSAASSAAGDGWMPRRAAMDRSSSSRRRGQDSEEGELPLMWEGNWGARSWALGQMTSQLTAYGSGLEGSPWWVTLWWVSATGHLIRKKKMMKKRGRSLMLTGHQGSTLKLHRVLLNEAAEHIDTCHEMLLVDPSLALSTLKGGSHPLHKHSAVFQRAVCATCRA